MATRLFGSQTSLREANRANLLASIHKFGAMTQVELAEVTGLSTATVSTLVHQLVDEDQLETKSTVRNGRRATGDPCTASGPRRRALDRATSSYAFYR